MNLSLSKKPKGVTVIEGFPGFGLVGTITTEYLLQHLDCELLGQYWFEELPSSVAIHEGDLVSPMGIFYNEKHNLVIIHAITQTVGVEWKAAHVVEEVCKELEAKELLCIEGVASAADAPEQKAGNVFFFTKNEAKEDSFKKLGLSQLNEGIVMGVTSALILTSNDNLTALFSEVKSQLPDSMAASEVIKVLDKYLGLEIDPKPLVDMAKKFEAKIDTIMKQSMQAFEDQKNKKMTYVG